MEAKKKNFFKWVSKQTSKRASRVAQELQEKGIKEESLQGLVRKHQLNPRSVFKFLLSKCQRYLFDPAHPSEKLYMEPNSFFFTEWYMLSK